MKKILKLIIAIVVLANMLFAGLMLYPVPEILKSLKPNDSVKIYDRNKKLLFELSDEKTGRKSFIEFEKIPQNLKNAFIAIEDKRFYEHSGVDFSAILRAIWQNVSSGGIVSGGSTITQQAVRNIIGVNKKRTFFQKAKESVIALKISKFFDKDEIFEIYLNSIYFGGLAYGVESASWQYFDKSAINLDLAEAAFLAGIPQSPNKYYPFKNFDAAKKRQAEVLAAMLKNKLINQTEYSQAAEEKITIKRSSRWSKKAPHFVNFVLQFFQEENASGLPKKIVTTLDYGMQERVENILKSDITFLAKYNIENAAVIVLDPKNGDILCMIGSVDYSNTSINGEVNVTTSLRQPGSSIKPLIYALALERGWSANTVIADEPVSYVTADGTSYAPKNFDLLYHGNVTLAAALAQSLNIPAVKTLNFVGISSFLQAVKTFGIKTLDKSSDYYGLSLALGSGEVKLLELVNAYSVFANDGKRADVRFIDTEGASLGSVRDEKRLPHDVIQPSTAKTISAILSSNELRMPAFGEENPLKFSFPVAAKTGTTRNFRDNWTIGYTDDYAVGVWVGNSNGQFMEGVSGISGAGPIFYKIMNMLHENTGTKLSVADNMLYEGSETFPNLQRSTSPQPPATDSFRIISPFANDIFLFDPAKPKGYQKIELKASQKAKWYVGDKLIGEGTSILWPIEKGKHQIRAFYNNEERAVEIEVK